MMVKKTRHHGSSIFSALGQAFNLHSHSDGPDEFGGKHHSRHKLLEHSLAGRLTELNRCPSSELLSLGWMQKALRAAAVSISEAQAVAILVPPIDRDEHWVAQYLNESIKLLDLLNVARQVIGETEHRLMFVKLAVSLLVSTSEKRFEKARDAINNYSRVAIRNDKVNSAINILQSMVSAEEKGGIDLSFPFCGANLVTSSILCLVITALTSGQVVVMNLQATESYEWGVPLLEMHRRLKEAVQIRGTECCVREFWVLQVQMDKLLQALKAQNEDEVRLVMEEMTRSLLDVERGVQGIHEQINQIFHLIVANRNTLLSGLAEVSK